MNKWTGYQLLVCIALIIGAMIFEAMGIDFAVQPGDSTGFFGSQLLILFGFLVLSGLISLIFLFQTKKSDTFLKHPAWKKMLGIIFVWFILSFIGLILLFENDFLYPLTGANRVIFYVILYYFIFLFQLLMIAGVHKFSDRTVSAEIQIERAFAITALFAAILVFVV